MTMRPEAKLQTVSKLFEELLKLKLKQVSKTFLRLSFENKLACFSYYDQNLQLFKWFLRIQFLNVFKKIIKNFKVN